MTIKRERVCSWKSWMSIPTYIFLEPGNIWILTFAACARHWDSTYWKTDIFKTLQPVCMRDNWFLTDITYTVTSCGPSQVKLWKLQSPFSSANAIIFWCCSVKKQILSNLAIVVLHSFDFECQVCQRKEKVNPCLNTDTVLWWLQLTTEMGLASRFETYLTADSAHIK